MFYPKWIRLDFALNNTKDNKNIENYQIVKSKLFPKIFNSAIINQVIPIHEEILVSFCQVWRNGKRINIFHEKWIKELYFEKTIEDVTFHPLLWHENYVLGYYSEEWEGLMKQYLINY